MAKRVQKKAKKRAKAPAKGRKRAVAKKTAKRAAKRPAKRTAKRVAKRSAKRPTKKSPAPATLRTPPSSLDMNRTASAARSGRQAQADNQRRHAKFAAITGGDVDVDLESAYFSGDEGPGGDNPTPDQNDVVELGHAVGIEYADNEELKGGEEVAERDKHRWENE
jgi:hypothetical protein